MARKPTQHTVPVAHDFRTESRLLARLIRTMLATEIFASLADLTDAVKHRAARLRLPCTPQALSEAYAVISSNTSLVGEGPGRTSRVLECRHQLIDRTRCRRCGWVPPDATALTRAEAAAILHRLGVRL